MSFGQAGPYGPPGDPQQPNQQPGPPPGPPPGSQPGSQPMPPAGQFGPPPDLSPQQPQQPPAQQQPHPLPQQAQPQTQPAPQQPVPPAPPAPWASAPGQASQTPDWDALADTTAARGRRRKWLLIGGGALATVAVAGTVAALVVGSHKGGKSASGLPSPQKLPSSSGSPEPSFSQVAPPPPPNPRDFIAGADKDKAPLSTKTLFPHSKPSLDKRKYDRVDTATTEDCASATQGGLGSVLADNGCRKVLRATYKRDGVAVTVGVAVFDTKAAADKAKEQSTGNIASLPGDGPSFCRATACRLTANAEGRYAYFTVAGYLNGKAVPDDDKDALQAGRDVAGYTFRRIMARANSQAAASVATATPSPANKKQA
ncbi:hypothetical protein [Streptomyces rectiverticillatus]|uniref:hypothetical protein n=1 Tax=Streptomyces rectiverticillatus TaxID=173860 RepID=UPI001FE6B1C8|nr:hypothetical protein [Streptomyces rectiverticillatus]